MAAPETQNPQRESPLSIARKWLPWCLALIFAITSGWTTLVALEELSGGKHDSIALAIIAVVTGAAPGVPLIVLCAILMTSALDFGGGFAVVTARYLTEKFLEPMRQKRREEAQQRREEAAKALEEARVKAMEQGLKQGREGGLTEGRAAERRKWVEWNQRRLDAEAEGVPFDEPPPEPPPDTWNPPY